MSAEQPVDAEMLRMYWHTQWERVAKLEENRLQVSNFVVAASIVALGLVLGANKGSAWVVGITCVGVVLANLSAAWHCDRTERSVRMHRARSDDLLQHFWPYLFELRLRVGLEKGSWLDAQFKPRFGYTMLLQQSIHVILTMAAIALTVVTLAT